LFTTDLGFTALETSIHFIPLGVTAFLTNMIVPQLMSPDGPRIVLLFSWLFAIAGVTLFTFVDSTADYWRLVFPGMILYIIGLASGYYVSLVRVVISASAEDQGSVAGVFNVSLHCCSNNGTIGPLFRSAPLHPLFFFSFFFFFLHFLSSVLEEEESIYLKSHRFIMLIQAYRCVSMSEAPC
jgi:predicted MFS family arabinose efflux permease